MNKQLLKDGFGWGLFLWFIGYILGIVFFMLVPPAMIGFVVMPIGIIITLWVLFKKIGSTSSSHYLLLAITWTAVAVIFDYLFIVKAFKSTNYYKLDVYLYYLITFVLPLLAGWKKSLSPNGGKLRA